MKTMISNPALRSWSALNSALQGADEVKCRTLLDEELKGRNRRQFVSRIHSRLNKARADKERLELDINKG
jgi:hypothetical protein